MNRLITVRESLDNIIDHWYSGRYSLEDARKLSELAMLLEEQAYIIAKVLEVLIEEGIQPADNNEGFKPVLQDISRSTSRFTSGQ